MVSMGPVQVDTVAGIKPDGYIIVDPPKEVQNEAVFEIRQGGRPYMGGKPWVSSLVIL